MKIDSLSNPPGANIWYDDSFRRTLESYITHLKTDSTTVQVAPDAMTVYKYTGDYFGLLSVYSVPTHLHWLTMRMNGLTSPSDCGPKIRTILVPNATTVDYIRQAYMSTKTITK